AGYRKPPSSRYAMYGRAAVRGAARSANPTMSAADQASATPRERRVASAPPAAMPAALAARRAREQTLDRDRPRSLRVADGIADGVGGAPGPASVLGILAVHRHARVLALRVQDVEVDVEVGIAVGLAEPLLDGVGLDPLERFHPRIL